jgi:hypothetical protein
MTDLIVQHGSALDFEPAFAANFQLLHTDPPFRDHVHKHAVTAGMVRYGQGYRKRELGFRSLSVQLRRHIAAFTSNVDGWSLVHSDIESANLWRISCEAAGAEYIRPVPWIRWSQPQKSGDRPTQFVELVTVYHRMHHGPRGGRKPLKKRWSGPGGNESVFTTEDEALTFRHASERGSDKTKHTTAKPLDQALDVVCWFSSPGADVFDPTCGRGTAGVACALLGRGFMGIELQKKEAKLARERIEKAAEGELSKRDLERAKRWAVRTYAEAGRVPEPKDKSMVRTFERATRRLEDVARLCELLGWGPSDLAT